MRLSVVLLVVSLCGVLGGAVLIGRVALGVAIVADSVAVGVFAVLRDDGRSRQEPQVHEVPTLASILEKARRAG